MPLLCALAVLGPTVTARDLLNLSIEKMGGRERLLAISKVKASYVGHETLPEQSERPTGPYLNTYVRGNRTFDFRSLSISGKETSSGLVYGPDEFTRNVSENSSKYETARRLALGPERILLTASSARDLHLGKEEIYQGSPHALIEFTWGSVPVKVRINRNTLMPTSVTTVRMLDGFWGIWGDTQQTTSWGAWTMLSRGYFQPAQIVTDVNGVTTSDTTVLNAEVVSDAPQEVPVVPPPTTAPQTARYVARYAAKPVVPGIVQYSGPFNTTIVTQGDHLTVIEPVLDSWFAQAFLDRLHREYPGYRVKAVLPTDDAWPHFGGIRTFISQGAQVIGLKQNRAIVERLLRAPYVSQPDALAGRPRKARFIDVDRPTTVGTGPNQMVLYPILGESSERMLMVYFPTHRLLYGSDLLQRQGKGFFFPAYPKELVDAVKRYHLDVETVFGEHLAPTPWREVTEFVEKQFNP